MNGNHEQCTARTKKNKPCPFNADRWRKGLAYCHVHDPEGTFQKQVRARRNSRLRKNDEALRLHETLDQEWTVIVSAM